MSHIEAGVAFSKLMKLSHRRGFIDRESYVAQYLALALFTIGVTRTLGVDDLLAAFACGSSLTWFCRLRLLTPRIQGLRSAGTATSIPRLKTKSSLRSLISCSTAAASYTSVHGSHSPNSTLQNWVSPRGDSSCCSLRYLRFVGFLLFCFCIAGFRRLRGGGKRCFLVILVGCAVLFVSVNYDLCVLF